MNFRKIKYPLFASMMAFIAAFSASCADDLEIGGTTDESKYQGIYTLNAHLKDVVTNSASPIVELYTDDSKASVRLSLSKAPSAALSVKLAIDEAYLMTYNQAHGTDFKLYPTSLVALDNEGVMSFDSDKVSSELSLKISTNTELEEDVTYVIPLAVEEVNGNVQFANEEARHCMYLVKDMRSKGNAFKGDDLPKGILFFEVNDVNPLNALCFQLENGKYLWDAVVLFAGNINYDPVAGRPFVNCNPNVQFLLDNNEEYLQPLRKRGIKVILGILGNHDQAGVAQLSPVGCKDFARELAQYCYAYNLDGVNFDDEYSDPNPDLNNPAFAYRSYEAGARLCLETKRAMPDKLVTVFDYGYMHGTNSVDGVSAEEYTDIAVPDYHSGAANLRGNMTNKQVAGFSMEFMLQRGGNLNPEGAKRLLDGGYGWFMGFAPFPNRFSLIWNRLTGAETLYGSPLKDPTFFYKKNDTKKYAWPAEL